MSIKHDPEKLASYYERELGLECLTLVYVNPQLLHNDRQHYQRFRMESKVLRAIERYDDDRPPIAFASRRADASLWLIDRQHHAEAAIRLGITQIPVLVFDAPTIDPHTYEKMVFDRFQTMQLEDQ
jgi:hypothetical protein